MAQQHKISGLSSAKAAEYLQRYGPNLLPVAKPPSIAFIFVKQFLDPLIYILLIAAIVSLVLGEAGDAVFIAIVLVVNAIIATFQEYRADRAAQALKKLEQSHAIVLRDGMQRSIAAENIVPGDVVLLEAGSRVAADIELLECNDLLCDESLLTGESLPVKKSQGEISYAGAMATRGRGHGIVIATGLNTEMGKIAKQVSRHSDSLPPLIIRMKRFTRNIAIAAMVSIAVLIVIGLLRQMDMNELFMMSVGLAVSAIPEGLPIAISIALAIAMRRMAKVNVIVRHMPAVEALGSCTMIATDKTGTLTMNKLTVTDIILPDGTKLICETGQDINSCSIKGGSPETAKKLLYAAALPNEAELIPLKSGIDGIGDTVDIALLVAAHKGGVKHKEISREYPVMARIPYEPELKYAASFHKGEKGIHVFVKGAPESIIEMCGNMQEGNRKTAINAKKLTQQKEQLTAQGLRVLAFAEGIIEPAGGTKLGHGHLINLTFLGMAGMQDPIRPEVSEAISNCYNAGINIAMVTGDDPKTAGVIAKHAGIKFSDEQIVTGSEIEAAEKKGHAAIDNLTRNAVIYARVKPEQKLAIVESLARNGHYIAVTGDGTNDAPALKHAHVGIAMGLNGTDVARESADIILTDDNFASIVGGVKEGRVAYSNIRKVVFMLCSSGAAEVTMFLLAMIFGLPMPLLAVQLLWLNMVTNSIQDEALACERAEGDELSYKPRKPGERIFNSIMLRRIAYSIIIMGIGGFCVFWWLLDNGYQEAEARNLLLLLFVLFENFQTFNSRSENHSVFRQGFFANPWLVLSVITAQGIHIAAMYIPSVAGILNISPVSLSEWIWLILIASVMLAAIEFDKWLKIRSNILHSLQ